MRALRGSVWGLLAAAMFAGCGDDGGTTTGSTATSASSGGTGGQGGEGGSAASTGGAGGDGGGAAAGGAGGAGGGAGSGGAPTALWSRSFGGSKSDRGRAIAVDSSGGIVLTGRFADTVDFGGVSHVAVGAEDIFVLKLDADGNTLWTHAFGGIEDDEGVDIGVDAAGNVIFVAAFEGDVDFGGGALIGAGKKDLALVKLSPDGTHVWSKRIGGASNENNAAIAVMPNGEIALTGGFLGTLNFDGTMLTAAGPGRNVFVARADANGAFLWAKRFEDADLGMGSSSIAFDAGGGVVVVGDFAGSVDFGGGALNSAGAIDAFVLKLNSQGGHVWSKHYGDSDPQASNDVKIDAAGHILLVGRFEGTIDFGGGALTSADAGDVFVAELDAGGAHVASRAFGGALDQEATAIALGGGKVALTGTFDGDVDFGGGKLTSAGGLGDVLVAALTSVGGSHVWSAGYGDAALNTQAGYDLAIDSAGAVVVTGTFGGTVDFGAGPHQGAHVDVFVTKYAP